jgi:adenylate kinase
MQNIVPTLSDGLLEVAKVQPEDPVEFLAEYLFEKSFDL